MKKSIFVTDRGSNMVKVFSGLPHLNCTCHILNNILHNTFQSQRSEARRLHNDWINLLETTKTVVKYLKHAILTSYQKHCFSRVAFGGARAGARAGRGRGERGEIE